MTTFDLDAELEKARADLEKLRAEAAKPRPVAHPLTARLERVNGRLSRLVNDMLAGEDVDTRLDASEFDVVAEANRVTNAHGSNGSTPNLVGYELSASEVDRAAARALLFQNEVAHMDPAEMRANIEKAQAARDLVTLHLYASFAPVPELRAKAKRIAAPADLVEAWT